MGEAGEELGEILRKRIGKLDGGVFPLGEPADDDLNDCALLAERPPAKRSAVVEHFSVLRKKGARWRRGGDGRHVFWNRVPKYWHQGSPSGKIERGPDHGYDAVGRHCRHLWLEDRASDANGEGNGDDPGQTRGGCHALAAGRGAAFAAANRGRDLLDGFARR